MSDIQIQLDNGDIKCEKCDEPATQHSELKFYCAAHIAIQRSSDEGDEGEYSTCETCDKKCGENEGEALLFGSYSAWLCLECYAKEAPAVLEAEAEAEMEHLEAQVEAHIEKVADSAGGRK